MTTPLLKVCQDEYQLLRKRVLQGNQSVYRSVGGICFRVRLEEDTPIRMIVDSTVCSLKCALPGSKLSAWALMGSPMVTRPVAELV